MSGLIGAAFGLTETLGDAAALLGGTSPGDLLADGSFRGVRFSVRSSTDAMGRRVVPYLYPGVDQASYPDLGALDGGIRIEGLIVGPDMVPRADRLRAAFRAPGPGLLSHPWLGVLRVQLIEPAEFAVADNALGEVHFRAAFVLADPPAPPAIDTLGAMLDAADAVLDAVDLVYSRVLSLIRLPAALVAGVEALLAVAASCWGGLLPGAPDAVGAAIAAPLAAIGPGALAAPTGNVDTSWALAVSSQLGAVPGAVASVVGVGEPAIGPGASAAASDVDPRAVTTLLLSAAAEFATQAASVLVTGGAQGAALAVLAAGCQAQALAQGAASAGAIAYTSQDDAVVWRTRLLAALEAHSATLDAIAAAGGQVQELWTAAAALGDAVTRDIDADLGRLPAVVRVWLAEPVSVWQLALWLAGDAPATMADVVADLVARNDIRHPAIVPAGWIETLRATTQVAA